MMIPRTITFLLLCLVCLGCERGRQPYGGASGPRLGTPEYKVIAQLSAIPAKAHVADVAPSFGQDAVLDGSALYMKSCGACHQSTGLGLPPAFPPLDRSPYVLSDNTERMAAIMVYGLVGPVKVLGTQYTSAMAGLGAQFNDDELAAIASYVRSSWSNSADAVSAEKFAAVRKKWGARGPFSISELGEEQ